VDNIPSLVERLRNCPHKPCQRCEEAADEIERSGSNARPVPAWRIKR